MRAEDVRASVPICTVRQAAELAGMPISTFYSWMRPARRRPALIHHVPAAVRGWPTIPLVGLAEAVVLRELREGHMRMDHIAAAVSYLRERGGDYALASPDLLHDGVVALVKDEEGLRELVTGQPLLPGVVGQYLRPFRLAPDGFVEALLVERIPGVEIDPRFSSGRMRFTRTGVPLFAIAGALEADDPPEVVAAEYGLTDDEVERVNTQLPWISQTA